MLVTGASGFIGRRCLRHLVGANFEVHAVSREVGAPGIDADGVRWHRTNLLEPERVEALVECVGASHLFHAAWIATPGVFWNTPENLDWVAASALRIVEALSFRESAEIVAALDDETAAETLEEVSDERLMDLLEVMDQDRAADILEEMTPSAAADVLEDLGDDRAAELLARMEPEEAEDVKELLAYDGDSVGRLMMTDIITVLPSDTVGQVIQVLKSHPEPYEQFNEVFVVAADVDDATRPTTMLLGMVRADQLLLAEAHQHIDELLQPVPQVHPHDPAQHAARILGEYNLTAVPVVDEHDGLVGAVSVDDALAVLLPDIWQRRGARRFG